MSNLRRLVIAVTILICAAVPPPTGAAAQISACDDPLLAAFLGQSEYEEACAAFAACVEVTGDFVPCTPHFLYERLVGCGAQNYVCFAQAKLHTALIGLNYGNGYPNFDPANGVLGVLAAQIADYEALNAATFDEAKEWFGPVADEYRIVGLHPMLAYAYGVLYELKDDPNAALEQYDLAVARNSNDPLIYWARGELHGRHGDPRMAGLDHALLELLLGAPELYAGGTGLDERDLMSADYAQWGAAYLRYPMVEVSWGLGGGAAFDNTLDAPFTFRLVDDGQWLVYVPAQDTPNMSDVELPFYVLAPDKNGFMWSGADWYEGIRASFELHATETEGAYSGIQTEGHFEGTTTFEFMIAPDGANDPRPALPRCDGAPFVWLEGARRAVPYSRHEPVKLYNAPGGQVAVEYSPEERIDIVLGEGPVCDAGFTWWRVTVNGENSGWIHENADATRYLFDASD